MSKLSAVISIAFSCKLHPSGTGGGQSQTMKCNVCKYYLPQLGLIDGWFPLWEKLKFKSSLSHQHTLVFRLHYSLQSLHYSSHLASHFVTRFIYKEPLKVSMIIMIIIIIITLSSFYGVEDWGLCRLSLPHLLPSLWFWGVCVACQVFISELWHLNQDSDLRPNSASGVPQGTTTAVSSVFEQYLRRNSCWNMSSKDVLRICMTFSKDRGNLVICRLKAITGSIFVGVTQQRAKFTSHLLAKTWCSVSGR